MKKSLPASLVAIIVVSSSPLLASFDMKAVVACQAFATSNKGAPSEAETTCLGPATEGLPTAQYALGVILLSRQRVPEGLEWLETAASSRHPPASHLLAEIYLQSRDRGLEARGRELLRFSICAGFPPALASQHRSGLGSIECASPGSHSFYGSWTAQLNWSKAAPDGDSADELRIVVASGSPKVYMHANDEWVEVKPGRFTARQEDDTLIVSALDSGWDLDGKWVESWTIHLLRVGPNDAWLTYVGTVNNIHLPESVGFKTFSMVAEGRAIRTDK